MTRARQGVQELLLHYSIGVVEHENDQDGSFTMNLIGLTRESQLRIRSLPANKTPSNWVSQTATLCTEMGLFHPGSAISQERVKPLVLA